MGSDNYLIVDKWKLAFKISRHVVHKELEVDDMKKLIDSSSSFRFENMESKLSEVTLEIMSDIIQMVKRCWIFQDINSDMFLIWWLQLGNIKYDIIPEDDIESKIYEFHKVIGID